MKKTLTLLIAIGSFIAVNAQFSGNGNNPKNDGRDVILGGGNNNGSYPKNYPSNGGRQAQIDQVNREYDAKINSVRNNAYLNNQEKDRSIRQLENDRQRRIQEINNATNNGGYKDLDRGNDRGNNGKHKGWDKKNKNKNGKHDHKDHDRDDEDD